MKKMFPQFYKPDIESFSSLENFDDSFGSDRLSSAQARI